MKIKFKNLYCKFFGHEWINDYSCRPYDKKICVNCDKVKKIKTKK